MKFSRAVALALVAVAACTKPNATKACKDGSCLNPEFPYCDSEGIISGEPGTCIAVTCTPGEVEGCLGDDALTCNATGDGYDRVPCSLGCGDTPEPHCKYIEPRYLPDVCDTPATTDSFDVTSSGSLDPNLDSNCNGGVVMQAAAPSICILHYRQITIGPDAALKIIGPPDASVGRSIALVADEEITVTGTLDISADGPFHGPGGGVIISGGWAFVTNSTTHVAAGGAGGRTPGGAGGSSSADGGAMNGGQALADPSLLAALVGGATSYRMETGALNSGGGGGAATLVSCRGRVSIGGLIDAGGGGGVAGVYLPFPGTGFPGLAGGAGGYVVLQAPQIEVTGQMFANGGGGGGGMRTTQANGAAGEDGSLSTTLPATGGYPQNGEGRGGAGGIEGKLPGIGGKPAMTPATAGGGGGSIGFFQTYTPEGVEPALTPTDVSPTFQPNGTINTR